MDNFYYVLIWASGVVLILVLIGVVIRVMLNDALTVDETVYVLMGYDQIQEGQYHGELYGVYSNVELAKIAGDELVEAEVISHYEIECPKIDEFGYK